MEKHIEKTVADLDFEIAERQKEITTMTTAKAVLVELYGVPVASAPVKAEKPGKVKKQKRGGQKAGAAVGGAPATAPEGVSGKTSSDTVAAIAKLRTLPEPFTAASVSVATGRDMKASANLLNTSKAKGWLEKAGRGEYKRTKDFPPAPL